MLWQTFENETVSMHEMSNLYFEDLTWKSIYFYFRKYNLS